MNTQIPIYENAQKNCSRWFGFVPSQVSSGDLFTAHQTSLWGFESGNGEVNDIIGSQVHFSADLTVASNEPPIGFYMLLGSWFGDWNLQDNFMRACLGTSTYGLGALWTVATKWNLGQLALAESLGTGFLDTLNDLQTFPSGGNRELTVSGDPSLRLQLTAPPTNLSGSSSPGRVDLNWTASADSGATYFVYRDTSFEGSFGNRLTPNPISSTTFTDSSAPTGQKVYQVRALKLLTTGSGSFTNLSQGVFVIAN